MSCCGLKSALRRASPAVTEALLNRRQRKRQRIVTGNSGVAGTANTLDPENAQLQDLVKNIQGRRVQKKWESVCAKGDSMVYYRVGQNQMARKASPQNNYANDN